MAVSQFDPRLQAALREVLQRSPGLPAKALARELREMLGQDVHKADINPILYGQRGLFRFDGYSPPRWFVIEAPHQPSSAPAAYLTPRQAPTVERKPWTDAGLRPPAARPVPLERDARRTGPIPPPMRFVPPPQKEPLYRWQEEALAAWYENGGRGVIEAVTGTGKTRVALQLLRDMFAQGTRTLILVPTTALQKQWLAAIIGEFNLEVTSVLGGGYGAQIDPACPVTVAVVNTACQISDVLDGLFDCVIADECHNYGSRTRRKALLSRASLRLGLTATFERSDNGIDDVLTPYFGGRCYQYGYSRARADGVIAPFSVLAIGVDLECAEREAYDTATERMQRAMQQLIHQFGYPASHGEFMDRANRSVFGLSREGALVGTYNKAMQQRRAVLADARGKRTGVIALTSAIRQAKHTLIFSETIDSADEIAILLQDEGIRAVMYHTKMDSRDREEVLADLVAGDLDCVVGVRALDEGIDIPDVDLGIVVASSRQRRQMVQRMGRIVRKKDDGRGASFVVLFARGTNEDPTVSGRRGPLDELWQHADNVDVWEASELTTRDVGDQIFEWIWDPGPRSAMKSERFVPRRPFPVVSRETAPCDGNADSGRYFAEQKRRVISEEHDRVGGNAGAGPGTGDADVAPGGRGVSAARGGRLSDRC